MTQSLAERLRADTKALHTAAERSAFMQRLLRGEMPREAYCALLRNLQAIYAALEAALARHAALPALAPFPMRALRRAPALESDLTRLHGTDWRDAIALQPAALAYAQRLRELDASQPRLLLAHAYVRYLGDLSGGQLLRRIVARDFGIAEGEGGTAFYDFGAPPDAQALARAFRDALGEIALDAAGIEAVVGEAMSSFRRHARLFDELARQAGWIEIAHAEVSAP